MTPEEKQKRIEALEAEIAELKKPEKTAGQRFWELVSGTEVKFDFDKWPHTIFGFRGHNYVWEFDFENSYLWLRYSTVWSVLETEYSLNYNDVQALVRSEVEEHLKCRGLTSQCEKGPFVSRVEEHLKCRGVTPYHFLNYEDSMVESHFNGRSEAKEASNQSVLEYIIL